MTVSKCPIGNECELNQDEYCPWESECHKHREYLDSPAKAESDRREAERWKQYEESGYLDDLPF